MPIQAVSYGRKSDVGQSVFTIDSQLRAINEFAERNGYEIAKEFKDDGKSARTFENRPGWLDLEKFIRKTKIRYIIVWSYSRFSRDAGEAMEWLEKVEKKYNVRVLSISEQIPVDHFSPLFFKLRAMSLVDAEFESRMTQTRIKFGQRQALKKGRYIYAAPFGYVKLRNERNEPYLSVQEPQAQVVRNIYRDFIAGKSEKEITRNAKRDGFNRAGNGAVKRILTYPVYAGLIEVPEANNEPAQTVKATHERIVSESDFYLVQDLLNRKNAKRDMTAENEHVPLRGVLLCECGKRLTGGLSKGKYKSYPFYRCLACNANHPAERIHKDIADIIRHTSLSNEHVTQLETIAENKLKQAIAAKTERLKAARAERQQCVDKIENLEGKYIDDLIDQTTYAKWIGRYRIELANLDIETESLAAINTDVLEQFRKYLPNLRNIGQLYERANISQRRAFVSSFFKGGLTIMKDGYRTPQINALFTFNLRTISNLDIQNNIYLGKRFAESLVSGAVETNIEHFNAADLADAIKTIQLLAA